MKRTPRILLALVLILMGISVGIMKDDLQTIESRLNYISEALESRLDLSILDACGIITDGYGFGSCVAIAPDIILTAGHCIHDTNDTWIEIGDVKYDVLSKWRSDKYDVGFVRIDGEVPFIQQGAMPELLQEVYLVGTPYDMAFRNAVTKGIVSKLGVDWFEWSDLIEVDAEAAHGSSGCPLFDKDGNLLGIIVSGPNPGGGVSLCVPITQIKEAYNDYMQGDDPM